MEIIEIIFNANNIQLQNIDRDSTLAEVSSKHSTFSYLASLSKSTIEGLLFQSFRSFICNYLDKLTDGDRCRIVVEHLTLTSKSVLTCCIIKPKK